MSEFDSAVAYALEHVGCPALQLNPEQTVSTRDPYDRKDVFVWLPTGFGRSVCYTTLLFVFNYNIGCVDSGIHIVVLVVKPLIVLMIDQV